MKFDIEFLAILYAVSVFVPLFIVIAISIILPQMENSKGKDSKLFKFFNTFSDVLIKFGFASFIFFVVLLTIYGFVKLWDLI